MYYNALWIKVIGKAAIIGAYLLVPLLDLLHVALFTETSHGDEPDGYMEAMAICASRNPNMSIFL